MIGEIVIDVPAGTEISAEEMQRAHKVVVGGQIVKNRNGAVGHWRQFVACAFKEGGRTYTYHWDGETPLKLLDRVRVQGRGGSEQIVTVVGLWGDGVPPDFETKPILGLADLASAAAPNQSEEN